MKRAPHPLLAFTLIEICVSLAVIGISGGIIVSAIRNVALLGAKNSAVNLTHQQSRVVLHHAVSELHQSVSIPSLINTSLGTVSGNGPAAGVTYQRVQGSPHKLWAGATAGTSVLRITSTAGEPAPQVGQRLIVPAFRIEENITGVVNNGGSPPNFSLTIATPLVSTITCTSGTPNYVAYCTQRSAMVMVGGEMRFFPSTAVNTYSVIGRNMTPDTPFSVPGGDNRFIQATFSAADPRIAGLNLKSMSMQLQIGVPYRCRLTTKQ